MKNESDNERLAKAGLFYLLAFHYNAHFDDVLKLIQCLCFGLFYFSIGVNDLIHVCIDFVLLGEAHGVEMLECFFDNRIDFRFVDGAVLFFGAGQSSDHIGIVGEQSWNSFGDHFPFGRMVHTIGMSHVYVQEKYEVGEVVVNDHASNIEKNGENKNTVFSTRFW